MRRAALVLSWALGAALLTGFEWEGALARLERELDSPSAEARTVALRRLAELPASEVRAVVLAALEDPDVDVRVEAARAAARLGLEGARPILLGWVDDPDETLREGAAEALGMLGGDGVTTALARALDDARANVRLAALEGLRTLADPAGREAIVRALDDADAGVRALAATTLGVIGAPDGSLAAHVRDDAPEVRAAVLGALARTEGDAAVPLFSAALDDDVVDVRLAAITALGRTRGTLGIASLEPLTRDVDPRVARAAVAALAGLDGDDALSAVVEAALGSTAPETAAAALTARARRDPDTTVSAVVRHLAGGSVRADRVAELLTAIAAIAPIDAAVPALVEAREAGRGGVSILGTLGASGHREALLPLLVALGASDPAERHAAALALRHHVDVAGPDGRAVEPALEALGHATEDEELGLVDLLGALGSPRAAAPLVAMLDAAPRPLLTARIARALGSVDADEARAGLRGLLRHDDPSVRDEAARAVGRIGTAVELTLVRTILDEPGPTDRHSALEAIAAMAARAGAADDATLAAQIAVRAHDDDETLADAAILALGRIASTASCDALGDLLGTLGPGRELAVLRALGRCTTNAARALLRDAITGDGDERAAMAAGVLGDAGSAEDAHFLIERLPSLRWPANAAASHALARLARRGLLDGASAAPICTVGERSHDPVVRANVAIALAALGARCDGGPAPERWLERPRSTLVRSAAARWLEATRESAPMGLDVDALLTACAGDVASALVAASCQAPGLSALGGRADVVAYALDGRTLLRERWVALRLGDGSVLLVRTDANARVLVEDAPVGPLALETPENLPLEP